MMRERSKLTMAAFALVIASLLALTFLHHWSEILRILGFAAIAFVAAGKFIVLLPVLETNVPHSPYFFATMISVMDVVTSLLVAAHLDLLYRTPWLGKRLEAMELNGRRTLSLKPWYRRSAVLSVVIFVMFPLTGTGAIGGTIFGRLIGLAPSRIVIAIAAGAVLGGFGMALAAHGLARILEPIRHTLWFRLVGYAVVALFIAFLVRQALRTPVRETPAGTDDGTPPS